MELHEIERDIEALKSSPLVLVCLYVAVDELDALLDQAINGTA